MTMTLSLRMLERKKHRIKEITIRQLLWFPETIFQDSKKTHLWLIQLLISCKVFMRKMKMPSKAVMRMIKIICTLAQLMKIQESILLKKLFHSNKINCPKRSLSRKSSLKMITKISKCRLNLQNCKKFQKTRKRSQCK